MELLLCIIWVGPKSKCPYEREAEGKYETDKKRRRQTHGEGDVRTEAQVGEE